MHSFNDSLVYGDSEFRYDQVSGRWQVNSIADGGPGTPNTQNGTP